MTAQPHEHLTAAVLRPVRGHHAFEGCVEQLATAIRLGVYPVGSLLPPERELAERLAVSRATLREAIAALRQAGLVETRRGRGGGSTVTSQARGRLPGGLAKISAATKSEWLDALEFRRVVEPGAAHMAASHDLDGSRPRPAHRVGGGRPRRLRQACPPAGRLPAAPHHRLAERVRAAPAGGDIGPVHPRLDARRDPVARAQHRPLAPPAPPDLPSHRRRSRRPRPQGDGGPLRRHRSTPPRPAGMRAG